MKAQRRRDTEQELRIRRALFAHGYRYRVDYRPEASLRTRGDLVFTRLKVVVYVDGCFWHGCPLHGTSPKSNQVWWREKINANIARDDRNRRDLEERGWTVIRVWEHESVAAAVGVIQSALQTAGTSA